MKITAHTVLHYTYICTYIRRRTCKILNNNKTQVIDRINVATTLSKVSTDWDKVMYH